jgi:uncharacterized protein (DUF885 family)
LVIALGTPLVAWADKPSKTPQPQNMADLVRAYGADEQSVREAFELPASTKGFDRAERLQQQWLKRLQAIDFDSLDHAGQMDYLLLENEAEQAIHGIAQQRRRLAEIDRLVGFRDMILDLEQSRRSMEPVDFAKVAGRLAQLAEAVKQLRERVEQAVKAKATADKPKASPPSKATAEVKPGAAAPLVISPAEALRTADTIRRLLNTLDDWAKQSNGFSPEFDWWAKKPYDDARKQIEDYAKFLREEVAGQKGKPDDPLVGTPIGADAVAAEIRFQCLPYTADELIAIGQRELAWGESQMKEESRRMGLGDDWRAALARVKADYVAPGGQAELIARIGREATAFVQERKLVTVPTLCQETWRTTMMSPEQLKTVPYAAYGGQNMLVAYAQQSMTEEDKLMVMRGNNRHFMRLVTPHELIPGHHLQGFYAARYQTHRERFSTPFYVEGWAFSWELRLWDLDWAKTPEDRIGMLFWRMTRAARIIVSLNYHLGRMKPEEMINVLVQRVGHEKFGATSEVRRFIQASPLYQASYMIGGMQLEALRRELTGPGKWTEQQFHDAVLQAGPMPIAALRADLTGMPLRRDTRFDWRFVEPKNTP